MNSSPGCRSDEPGYDLEQRGLAGPVVPDDAEDLPVFKLEADAIECHESIKIFREIAGGYHAGLPINLRCAELEI